MDELPTWFWVGDLRDVLADRFPLRRQGKVQAVNEHDAKTKVVRELLLEDSGEGGYWGVSLHGPETLFVFGVQLASTTTLAECGVLPMEGP
jgi:hypothetical protein